MKIGVVGDIHWSRYSSILRLRGEKYSYRLENCIQSVNWAENLTNDCEYVVYLGDFFDTPELNAEEITALKEIDWNTRLHYFLIGNHEMGINDLSCSSGHLFDYVDMIRGAEVIDKPVSLTFGNCNLHFIPYILEEQRKPLESYLRKGWKNIIFSHNDISGIQLGKFISQTGFSIDEIEQNCNLFINGHLHNGSKVTDKIINVGNLTGQNFGEDAYKYDHCILILDTDTLRCEVYENPYALNFYKIDTTVSTSIFDVTSLKKNSVVTLKTTLDNQTKYKNLLNESANVIASRLILVPTETDQTPIADSKEIFSVNHLNKFSEYVLDTLGKTEVVMQELNEVLK